MNIDLSPGGMPHSATAWITQDYWITGSTDNLWLGGCVVMTFTGLIWLVVGGWLTEYDPDNSLRRRHFAWMAPFIPLGLISASAVVLLTDLSPMEPTPREASSSVQAAQNHQLPITPPVVKSTIGAAVAEDLPLNGWKKTNEAVAVAKAYGLTPHVEGAKAVAITRDPNKATTLLTTAPLARHDGDVKQCVAVIKDVKNYEARIFAHTVICSPDGADIETIKPQETR